MIMNVGVSGAGVDKIIGMAARQDGEVSTQTGYNLRTNSQANLRTQIWE